MTNRAHWMLGRIGIGLFRRQEHVPDPNFSAALFTTALEIGIALGQWHPDLATEIRQDLEREKAQESGRPAEAIESQTRAIVGTFVDGYDFLRRHIE